MVNQQALDSTFHALADQTRRTILDQLAHGDATVGELATPFSLSLPAIMKHLRVLEDAGLVTTKKIGRSRHVRLRANPLREAQNMLNHYQQFWNDRLDALAELVEDEETGA